MSTTTSKFFPSFSISLLLPPRRIQSLSFHVHPKGSTTAPHNHHRPSQPSHCKHPPPFSFLGHAQNSNTTSPLVEELIQTLGGQPGTSTKFQSFIVKLESRGGFQSVDGYNDLLNALVSEDEYQLALNLSCSLISFYCCHKNDPFSAKDVLDCAVLEMGLQPDVATCTTLINSFCKNGRMQKALEVFEIMKRIKCEPTINTYNCLLKGLCYIGRIEEAYDLFTNIKRENVKIKPDIYSYTALMNGFCKVGRSNEALELLDEALESGLKPNAVTFNTLLNGFFKEGRPLIGVDLLKRMQEDSNPDYVSYNTLLHGLLKWGEVSAALDLYKEMILIGFQVDERLTNALLRGLCRRARKDDHLLKEIRSLITQMRSVISHPFPSYDMVIEAFCMGGEIQMALECLLEMIKAGIPPKSITFRHVVRALCGQGKVEEAVFSLQLMTQNHSGDDDNVIMPVNSFFGILIDELINLPSYWNVYGAAAIKMGSFLSPDLRNQRTDESTGNGCLSKAMQKRANDIEEFVDCDF